MWLSQINNWGRDVQSGQRQQWKPPHCCLLNLNTIAVFELRSIFTFIVFVHVGGFGSHRFGVQTNHPGLTIGLQPRSKLPSSADWWRDCSPAFTLAMHFTLLFFFYTRGWKRRAKEREKEERHMHKAKKKEKKKTVFHWERNLQDQWHKCDFWTMLMFFKCITEAYKESRWPLVCPCVRPRKPKSAAWVRENTVCRSLVYIYTVGAWLVLVRVCLGVRDRSAVFHLSVSSRHC